MHYEDDVYAFFQNCYHLKDWIKNDQNCSEWSDVEKMINENYDLKICADLCNALKHLTLTRPRSSDNPNFIGNYINLNINDGVGVKENTKIFIKYSISTNSECLDAYQTAERCIEAWDKYIINNSYTSQ
jgi:hypothetical protein